MRTQRQPRSDLIAVSADGVETPSAGTWRIEPHVATIARRRWRRRAWRRTPTTAVIDGSLDVESCAAGGHEPSVVLTGRCTPVAVAPIDVSVRLTPNASGDWGVAPDDAASAGIDATRSLVRYHGVFNQGAHPVAWLELRLCWTDGRIVEAGLNAERVTASSI